MQVEQRLGDAVVQRHAAQVAQRLHVQQVLHAESQILHELKDTAFGLVFLKLCSVSGLCLTLGRVGLLLQFLFLLKVRDVFSISRY